jgi:peptidoglycan/LPS O-acetylase OafA/YrhL
MQTTKELQFKTVGQAEQAVRAPAKAASRLAYIDMVRVVLAILVIMVHAAVTYGSLGDWTYEDPVQDEFSAIMLSFFVIICQSFFMGLFIFFSGYFTPGSYDRKGLLPFWKDRLLRLGLPMALYTLVLCKFPNYINEVANNGMQLSFGQYFVRHFWLELDEGPTWFLFALLIFSAGYTLWRLATRKATGLGAHLNRLPAPTTRSLLIAALVMALFTFLVSLVWPIGEMYDVFGIFSLQLQFFPTYILLFIAGTLAYRSQWLEQLPGKSIRFWSWLSLVLAILLPVLLMLGGAADDQLNAFMTGMNWRHVVLSLWLGLACISFSMTVTLWARDHARSDSRLIAFAGPHTFTVYLIHPLVLVPVTLGLSYLVLPGLVKFGIASIITVGLCFLLAYVLRRIPGLKAIL